MTIRSFLNRRACQKNINLKLATAQYLINGYSHYAITSRPGVGIAVIVLYFVFLLPVAITYFRLVVSTFSPGYVDKGTHAPPKSATNENPLHSTEPSIGLDGQPVSVLNIEGIFQGHVAPPPGLSQFYARNLFVCDSNGLPIWCRTCAIWKPDRAHHCSDVGRCVLKLDHFCPWVGGVVAEANYKFFIQFVTYTAIYTLYIMIVMAYFWADRSSEGFGVNGNWLATLVLSVLFFIFTAGMSGNSIQLALKNTTTIDHIGYATRTMHLAVYLPNPQQYYDKQAAAPLSPAIQHSLPAAHTQQAQASAPDTTGPSPSIHSVDKTGFEKGECLQLMFQGSRARASPSALITPHRDDIAPTSPPHPWVGTITYPLITANTTTSNHQAPSPRTFAILRTNPGMNPWNLSPLENWRQVMGLRAWDWFLPIRRSPCSAHTRDDSLYPLGKDVDRLTTEAGLDDLGPAEEGTQAVKTWARPSTDTLGSASLLGGPDGSTLGVVDGFTGRERVEQVVSGA